jgi:hypothetical protein
MPEPEKPLLDRAAHADVEEILARVSAQPTLLVKLAEEIHDLDPLRDALRLSELRSKLRAVAVSIRDDETDDKAVAESVHLLLNRVTARQSPVGAGLRILLDKHPDRLTPAVLRAARRTDDRAWTARELGCVVEQSALAFLTGELASLGVVTQDSTDRDPMQIRYRLTPAGREALPLIARRVLELELGRFPWPADLRDPEAWASSTHAAFFEFDHLGRDDATLARCLDAAPREIGSLSLPNLYGIARPEDRATLDLKSVAVLRREPGAWNTQELNARIDDIIDDQLKLMARTDTRVERWELMMFTRRDLDANHGRAMRDACDAAHVTCSFVH